MTFVNWNVGDQSTSIYLSHYVIFLRNKIYRHKILTKPFKKAFFSLKKGVLAIIHGSIWTPLRYQLFALKKKKPAGIEILLNQCLPHINQFGLSLQIFLVSGQ